MHCRLGASGPDIPYCPLQHYHNQRQAQQTWPETCSFLKDGRRKSPNDMLILQATQEGCNESSFVVIVVVVVVIGIVVSSVKVTERELFRGFGHEACSSVRDLGAREPCRRH